VSGSNGGTYEEGTEERQARGGPEVKSEECAGVVQSYCVRVQCLGEKRFKRREGKSLNQSYYSTTTKEEKGVDVVGRKGKEKYGGLK